MADQCAKCGERPPGEGGILCPECKAEIERANEQRGDVDVTGEA